MWYSSTTEEQFQVSPGVLRGALVPEFHKTNNKGRAPKSTLIREKEQNDEAMVEALQEEAERIAELNQMRLEAFQEQYGEQEGARMAAEKETPIPEVPPMPPLPWLHHSVPFHELGYFSNLILILSDSYPPL